MEPVTGKGHFSETVLSWQSVYDHYRKWCVSRAWKDCWTEIDEIKNIGNPSLPDKKWMDSSMMMNTHFYKDGWDNDINTPYNWSMPTDSVSGYHIYGVW